MSLDQDNFEKLEAYLDGALGAAERAEVDRQLAGNPQLRKMMQELASTRDWVAVLPRASAPPDVIETFQGQLERDALLGESGPAESDVVLRISRWPQFMSVAAVVLLAFGLALVLYKVLPNKQANSVAVNPAMNPQGGSDASTKAVAQGEDKAPDTFAEEAPALRRKEMLDGVRLSDRIVPNADGSLGSSASKPSAVNAPTDPAGTVARDESWSAKALAKSIAPDRPQVTPEEMRETQLRMARGGEAGKGLAIDAKKDAGNSFGYGNANGNNDAGEEPIVLLVNAQDPRQAKQDVSDFLTKNGIVYIVGPDLMNRGAGTYNLGSNSAQLATSNPTSQEAYAKQDSPNFNFRAGGGTNGGAGGGGGSGGNTQAQTQTANSGFNNYGGNVTSNAASNVAVSGGTVSNSNMDRGAQNQNPAPAQAPAAPATAGLLQTQNSTLSLQANSATQPATPESGAAGGVATGNGASNLTLNGNTTGAVTLNGSRSYGRSGVYRAMLTHRQQAELNEFIARRGNQWAERRGEARADAAAPAGEPGKGPVDKAKDDLGLVGEKTAKFDLEQRSKKMASLEADTREGMAAAPKTLAEGEKDAMKQAEAGRPTTRLAPQAEAPRGTAKNESNLAPAALAVPMPTSKPRQLALDQTAGKNSADEPREVVIVVNEDPVILPTVLPASGATTQPAQSATQPATAPADKRADDLK
jgi:hypothetical protein